MHLNVLESDHNEKECLDLMGKLKTFLVLEEAKQVDCLNPEEEDMMAISSKPSEKFKARINDKISQYQALDNKENQEILNNNRKEDTWIAQLSKYSDQEIDEEEQHIMMKETEKQNQWYSKLIR
eukprot:403344116